MPLYTYVIAHKGNTFIAQTRRSNPKGFPDWMEALPPSLRRQVADPYHGAFKAVPNRQNVWQHRFTADGSELSVTVVQTDE